MPFNFGSFKKTDWGTQYCFKSFDNSFCCKKMRGRKENGERNLPGGTLAAEEAEKYSYIKTLSELNLIRRGNQSKQNCTFHAFISLWLKAHNF